MGYMLSSLGNLPVDEDIALYIFVVNGNWRGEPYDTIERNFESLAKQIGPKAVLAKGFEKQAWTSQVAKTYFGEDSRQLFNALPALLLTDAHPDHLTKDSLRLIIPLRDVQKRFEGWDEFFTTLSEFALNKNPAFLDRFVDQSDLVDSANSIIELKPNFFGLGVNLNAAIDRWRSKRNS